MIYIGEDVDGANEVKASGGDGEQSTGRYLFYVQNSWKVKGTHSGTIFEKGPLILKPLSQIFYKYSICYNSETWYMYVGSNELKYYPCLLLVDK